MNSSDVVQRNAYDRFILFRDALIDRLEKGEIGKQQFLEESYAYFEGAEKPDPQAKLGSFEQGMYLYQYYNIHAKMEKAAYQKLKYKEPFEAVDHRKASDRYYQMKERLSLQLLQFLNFKNIEAYYIKSDSRNLKSKLVEIIITDKEKAILHTLDPRVIEALKTNECLDHKIRTSKIHEYVNTKYY